MGTYGYAAPEYMATGHLTSRSDVYGFGVVFLETISGLRALDQNRPAGQHKLVEWTKPLLSDRRKIHRVIDPRLDGQYPTKAAIKAANLALQCLTTDAKQRPLMREVVEKLEAIYAIKEKTSHRQGERHGHSRAAPMGNGSRATVYGSPHLRNYNSPINQPNGSPLYSYTRSPRQQK
eukprot:TRINITY_DN1441_c0_g1_i1.p1 TRINITY_DN1441_c0_g1~~TRINITY_DN1441_c0_g1_i1.p1  ORF type:complete len:177 (-),score=28.18 TRINITY_DN1441_c0_g1_i1:456-986(-)